MSTSYENTKEENEDKYSEQSSIGLKLLKKMGFEEGKGLGVNKHGTTEPIDIKIKHSRSGIGIEDEKPKLPPHFKMQTHKLDEIPCSTEEKPVFISCKNFINLEEHVEIVERNDDEQILVAECYDKKLVEDLMAAKSQFDEVDDKIFRKARDRSNPFEKIGKSTFQNRAAVKIANLDHVCKLTNLEENETFYFADICAGPGGFTEYIYWKLKQRAKGWGFTLKGKDDWRLDLFNDDAPHDNFTIVYGEDDTGDITKNENILFLEREILNGTNQVGVSLLMGDGGFSVEGVFNKQEVLSKQLLLCQFLTALVVLKKGGNFVCKTFDLFTQFSIDLIFILYQMFEQICIIKPLSSRPANSERYVVCKNLRERRPKIVNFLFDVNTKLTNKVNIVSILKKEVVYNDIQFVEYIKQNNVELGKRQLIFLNNIKKFIEDPYLDIKHLQDEIKNKCLEEWKLPKYRERTSKTIPYDYRKNRRNYKRTRDDYRGSYRRDDYERYRKDEYYDRYRDDYRRDDYRRDDYRRGDYRRDDYRRDDYRRDGYRRNDRWRDYEDYRRRDYRRDERRYSSRKRKRDSKERDDSSERENSRELKKSKLDNDH